MLFFNLVKYFLFRLLKIILIQTKFAKFERGSLINFLITAKSKLCEIY